MDEKNDTKQKNSPGGKMLDAALDAYGIERNEVLSYAEYPEEKRVRIVTKGGKRIDWSPGDAVDKKLSYIERTGINPDAARRKPIAGKAKKGKAND